MKPFLISNIHRCFHYGNSVVEYALPMATVGILLLGVMMSGLFDISMESQLKGGQKADILNKTLLTDNQGHLTLKDVPEELHEGYFKGNGITYTKGNEFCLMGQFCSTVPNIPGKGVVEVDGGLGGGTVAKLSKLLSELADHLKQVGADSSFVSKVRALANRGHLISSSLLAGNQYKTPKGFGNDNEWGHMCELQGAIWKQAGDRTAAFRSDYASLTKFLKSNPSIEKQMPEAVELIRLASGNIERAGFGIQSLNAYNGVPYPGPWDNYTGKNVPVNGVMMVNQGRFIQMNANTICKAGEAGPQCMK
ncbi:MAG: hypothetical protein K2X66_11075 [Cyanobacteria bacterium]|nr:hypothetical protein [Cyanobacteriota bacterium]